MTLQLDSFRNAVAALGAVQARCEDAGLMASLDEVTRNAVRSGVIQHFEFTYELAWKFMRRQLEAELRKAAVDGVSRRELFRLAAEQHLIDDVEKWFGYHRARNETSQTYDPPVAAVVYASSLEFAGDAEALPARLEARNA